MCLANPKPTRLHVALPYCEGLFIAAMIVNGANRTKTVREQLNDSRLLTFSEAPM